MTVSVVTPHKLTRRKVLPANKKIKAETPILATCSLPTRKGQSLNVSFHSLAEIKNIGERIQNEKRNVLKEMEEIQSLVHDTYFDKLFSSHMEEGTTAQMLHKNVMVGQKETKYLLSLERAEQKLKKTVRIFETINKNKISFQRMQQIGKMEKFIPYGICEGCNTMIPQERLDACPHAILCVTCKQKER